MESEARYVWVGAAILALVLILAGGVYWLSGAAERLPTKRYVVYFQNQSLEGLQIGSPVRMQGIRVGRVEDYTILTDRPRTVRVVLEIDRRAPVLQGIQAEISRNLLTGLAAIDLTNPADGKAPLTDAPPGEIGPVIAEGEADLSRMAALVEDLGRTGYESLARLNRLLSDDNQKAFAATLRNLQTLSGTLEASIPELNATLVAARGAAEQVRASGAAFDTAVRDGGRRLGRVAEQAEQTLSEADQTLRDTRAALARLEQELTGVSTSLRLSAELASQEVEATGLALRQASEALQAAGRGFAEPLRLLHGPQREELGPGEVRP
ncbi:MAG: MlaD family protein [Thiobacillaceae bacterium]|nr:MlaD family protein [Thiobacillaceae bacterium]